MPFACFKSVREVSSEDSVHVASNLLQHNPAKKWKTKTPGEKSAYVILDFDEPYQITGIDIGNEHSAFVEVHVGKEGCAREAFSEILITCSFMTPIESKNSTNINRVRCFGQNALVETALPIKWKMIKVVCSQPFNKHVQFGLSFIKIHVVSSQESKPKGLVPEKFLSRTLSTDSNENGQKSIALGKFTLREDSPDSESESATGLFNRWKMSRNIKSDTAPTAAAAIREASSPTALNKNFKPKQTLISPKPSTSTQIKTSNDEKQILDRNRELLLFGPEDDEISNKCLEVKIEADKERLRIEQEKLRREKEKTKVHNENHTKPSTRHVEKPADTDQRKFKPTSDFTSEKAKKRHSSPSSRPAKKVKVGSNIKYLPFNKLLNGVCLVISGIQNPDRAELRRKALEMGAKYKADWESGCTHLICAFKNTPKYNQVKGKGKIITRSWIEKCYSLKKYLPWRRFALESSELAKPESDDEILDESQKPENEIDDAATECPSTSNVKKDRRDQALDIYDLGNTDEKDSEEIRSGSQIYNITSDSDTEDEILKATNANQKKDSTGNNKGNEKKDKDIYEVTTEEEDFLKDKISPSLKASGEFDVALAKKQHEAYVSLLREIGLDVIELPPDDSLPEGVFVENTAVICNGVALVGKSDNHMRQREVDSMKIILKKELDIPVVEIENNNAQLDGGDVLFTGREFFVGISKYTNEDGARAVAITFPEYPCTPIKVPGNRRLKYYVTMAGPDVLCVSTSPFCQEIVKRMEREASFSYQKITLPEEHATNMIYVNGTIIHRAPEEIVESHKVIKDKIDIPSRNINISQFSQFSSGLTSSCLLLRRWKSIRSI